MLHLQYHVGKSLSLCLSLGFLELFLHGGVTRDRDVRLPKMLTVGQTSHLFANRERRRRRHSKVRLSNNVGRTFRVLCREGVGI